MSDVLNQYVIYQDPKDHPGKVIVRHWAIKSTGIKQGEAWEFKSIAHARNHLRGMGLFVVPRSPDDDPVVVETWT